MAAETVQGATGFTEQPKKRTWQDGKGWFTTRSWEGPQSGVDAQVDTVKLLDPAPDAIRYTYGVPAVIEADFSETGGTATTIDTEDEASAVWELIAQPLEKDIRTHGYFNISGISTQMLEEVDNAIRRGTAGATDYDSLYSGMHLNSYRNHRLRGIEAYQSFSYIIRKTISTSKASTLDVDDVKPGQVVVFTTIGVPTTSKIQQPTIRLYENSAWTDKAINEWLVMAPTIRWTKSTKRYDLVREWWGAEKWSQALYENGTYVP